MQLCLIWAQAHHRAIGRANTLPWRLPEDLQHFKSTTIGSPVIMGRKTFESLPNGALPGRENIVVTRNPDAFNAPGARAVASLEDALAAVAHVEQAFVIGGAELYALALPFADRLFVTHVDVEVEGADAFAPEVPLSFLTYEFGPLQTSRTQLTYRFIEYRRAG
jgi:dihydrofolate reductase